MGLKQTGHTAQRAKSTAGRLEAKGERSELFILLGWLSGIGIVSKSKLMLKKQEVDDEASREMLGFCFGLFSDEPNNPGN
jgi:hypothetical protein